MRIIHRIFQTLILGFILSLSTYTQTAQAQAGAALDFDGFDDHIIIANNPIFSVRKFTIETWVKWGSSGINVNFICGKGTEQMEIHTGGALSNNIRFIPRPGVILDGGVNTITPNTWVHIACVYDPSISLAKMYINGVDRPLTVALGTLNTPMNTTAFPLVLGIRGNSGGFPYLGQMDEFRLWDYARTQAEIQANFNCEIPTNACGLLVNMHFNQGVAAGTNTTVTTLNDASSNSNNGTVANMALTGATSNFVAVGGVISGTNCAPITPPPARVFVDGGVATSGNGATWATAFKTLQEGIDALCAQEVWVKTGVYLPTKDPLGNLTPTDPRDRTFYISRNGIKIYGGFAGTETLLSQRIANTNITTLSGDLGVAGIADNAYHILLSVNDDATTFVDRFVVREGNANGTGNITVEGRVIERPRGGGMLNHNATTTITNCIFTANTATGGAAMNNNTANVTVTNCVFTQNTGDFAPGMNNDAASPIITNCVFTLNNATVNVGAISNFNGGNPIIRNTIIFGNTSAGPTQAINGTATITFSNIQNLAAAGNNISTAPLFVNVADPDGADNLFMTADDGLAIGFSSPCKDAGTNAGAPLTDILGVAIFNTTKDMGAYESNCATIIITPTPATASYVIGTPITITLGASGIAGATYTYAVTSGALPAGVTFTGNVISGTPTTVVAVGTGTFTITVTSNIGACPGTAVYNYSVACPTLVFTNIIANNANIDSPYTLNAGVTGNTQPVVYSVLPALPNGLNLNTVTGAITGTATVVTASAMYTITATQGNCTVSQSYTFAVVSCSPVVLGLASLPNAFADTPYTQTFTATGGATGATYAFSTTAPQLAATGLALNATGVLSGTPRFSTSITFTVTATTTPNGCIGTRVYTLVINPNPATAIDGSLANLVKISPNPFNRDFNVDFGGINVAKSFVRIYDMQGKAIFTTENNSNLITISLEKFANGIYLMEIETSKGRILKRLAKQ